MKTPFQLIFILFLFWVIVAGSIHPLDLSMGLAVTTAVGLATWKLLGPKAKDHPLTMRQGYRFLLYLPRLLRDILRANLYVARQVLNPCLPINPMIVSCRYPLTRGIAAATLANSITLTPGTLTVDLENGVFSIHCLSEKFAKGLTKGHLYDRVRHIFEED